MNFGKNESFFERHKYLFQNFYLKFEGLNDEIQTGFEDVVKRLSGIISRDADYILTEKSHFKKTENKNRTDLYSINYILDSIRAKQPLDINKYRFIPEQSYQSTIPCCLFSKYILKTNSCMRYYYQNICCRFCANNTVESISKTIENKTNDNYIISNTELEKKDINNEKSNMSICFCSEEKNGRKKGALKLNNISNWKVKKEHTSNDILNSEDKLSTILRNTKKINQNNIINQKSVLNDNTNLNDKLSTILLTDVETNERAKKLKVFHNKYSNIQQTNEDLDLMKHLNNHKKKRKIPSFQENLKKLKIVTEHPSFLLQNNVKNNDSTEINKNARKMIQLKDDEKQIKKHKYKGNNSSDNELTISSNDEINTNSKQKQQFNYKRIKFLENSDSSACQSDSSNIHNKDSGCVRKINNKKIYGKRRCRYNISLDRNSTSSSEDEINKIFIKSRKFNAKRTNKTKIHNRNINETNFNKNKSNKSSEEELSFTSNEEIIENNPKQWWFHLPVIKNVTQNFEEPKRNVGDRRRGTTFTLREQRLMIAYLIQKNKIHLGTSRLPWREMHFDGYMRNRSSESLNNNFRRVILPKIHTFGLPNNILLQFLLLKS